MQNFTVIRDSSVLIRVSSFGQNMFPILPKICEYDEGHDIIFRAYNRKEISLQNRLK